MSVNEKINIRSYWTSNYYRFDIPIKYLAIHKIQGGNKDQLKNLSHCDSKLRFKLLF